MLASTIRDDPMPTSTYVPAARSRERKIEPRCRMGCLPQGPVGQKVPPQVNSAARTNGCYLDFSSRVVSPGGVRQGEPNWPGVTRSVDGSSPKPLLAGVVTGVFGVQKSLVSSVPRPSSVGPSPGTGSAAGRG